MSCFLVELPEACCYFGSAHNIFSVNKRELLKQKKSIDSASKYKYLNVKNTCLSLQEWIEISTCNSESEKNKDFFGQTFISLYFLKLSKCEVKAAWCGNFTNCMPLRSYVKSNFGEFKRFKKCHFWQL